MRKPHNKHGPPAGMARDFVLLCLSVNKRLLRNKTAFVKVRVARFSGLSPGWGFSIPDFVVYNGRQYLKSG
jgi:hypothetical protein